MLASPIRSVLAATALAEAGDEALHVAGTLAAAAQAELHVIHALDLDLGAYPELGDSPDFPGRIAQVEEALARQLRRTLPPGVEAATREVVIYLAHRAILDRATDVRADVIVLGPHHRRALGERLLGTTADRVIRSAACPCLIVHDTLALPLRRVLVPLDLSSLASGALQAAVRWSEVLGARSGEPLPEVELDVVHVVPNLIATDGLPVNRAVIEPRLHHQVEEALAGHELAVRAREELVWGHRPAEEIVDYAKKRHSDLIVLATHGHGALRRALVGSVASAVARSAPCPVLLVPPAMWSHAGEDAGAEAAAAVA